MPSGPASPQGAPGSSGRTAAELGHCQRKAGTLTMQLDEAGAVQPNSTLVALAAARHVLCGAAARRGGRAEDGDPGTRGQGGDGSPLCARRVAQIHRCVKVCTRQGLSERHIDTRKRRIRKAIAGHKQRRLAVQRRLRGLETRWARAAGELHRLVAPNGPALGPSRTGWRFQDGACWCETGGDPCPSDSSRVGSDYTPPKFPPLRRNAGRSVR